MLSVFRGKAGRPLTAECPSQWPGARYGEDQGNGREAWVRVDGNERRAWKAVWSLHRLSLISQWRYQTSYRKPLLFYHSILTSKQSHSMGSCLPGRGLVCDQNLLSGRKKVPSPTQMPGREWCQMVTGPSFSATGIALCKGGKMPGQLLEKLWAAQHRRAPSVWGISDRDWWKKRTSPRDPCHLLGGLVRK